MKAKTIDGMTVNSRVMEGKGLYKAKVIRGHIHSATDNRHKVKVIRPTMHNVVMIEIKTKQLFTCTCCEGEVNYYLSGVMN